jgi:hypothetical protein
MRRDFVHLPVAILLLTRGSIPVAFAQGDRDYELSFGPGISVPGFSHKYELGLLFGVGLDMPLGTA